MAVTKAIGDPAPDWSMAFYHVVCLPIKFLRDINPFERRELSEKEEVIKKLKKDI